MEALGGLLSIPLVERMRWASERKGGESDLHGLENFMTGFWEGSWRCDLVKLRYEAGLNAGRVFLRQSAIQKPGYATTADPCWTTAVRGAQCVGKEDVVGKEAPADKEKAEGGSCTHLVEALKRSKQQRRTAVPNEAIIDGAVCDSAILGPLKGAIPTGSADNGQADALQRDVSTVPVGLKTIGGAGVNKHSRQGAGSSLTGGEGCVPSRTGAAELAAALRRQKDSRHECVSRSLVDPLLNSGNNSPNPCQADNDMDRSITSTSDLVAALRRRPRVKDGDQPRRSHLASPTSGPISPLTSSSKGSQQPPTKLTAELKGGGSCTPACPPKHSVPGPPATLPLPTSLDQAAEEDCHAVLCSPDTAHLAAVLLQVKSTPLLVDRRAKGREQEQGKRAFVGGVKSEEANGITSGECGASTCKPDASRTAEDLSQPNSPSWQDLHSLMPLAADFMPEVSLCPHPDSQCSFEFGQGLAADLPGSETPKLQSKKPQARPPTWRLPGCSPGAQDAFVCESPNSWTLMTPGHQQLEEGAGQQAIPATPSETSQDSSREGQEALGVGASCTPNCARWNWPDTHRFLSCDAYRHLPLP